MQASNPCAGRSRRRRLPTLGAAVTLVAVTSGVAVATASAATITVTPPCVVDLPGDPGSQMAVTGTGFTPGDVINVSAPNDAAFGYNTADAAGNLAIAMSAPVLGTIHPAVASFTLTASDDLNPLAVPPTATFSVANLAVQTIPAQAKPTKRVTWKFSGFIPGKTIYAHYLHGKKVTATKAFGRAAGPCGTLDTKAVFYPGKAKYATYKVQVDNSRRYSPGTRPAVLATLNTRLPLKARRLQVALRHLA